MISPLYLKLKIILLYIYIFNMDFQKEFFDASQNGHYNVVKLLLEDKRINPADRYNWAIQLASRYGHYNVVKLLSKDNRVNPADENNLAILSASANGHYNVVKLLLGDKKVINSFNIDIINYIKKYCSKEINDFYKNYFNLYKNYL